MLHVVGIVTDELAEVAAVAADALPGVDAAVDRQTVLAGKGVWHVPAISSKMKCPQWGPQ